MDLFAMTEHIQAQSEASFCCDIDNESRTCMHCRTLKKKPTYLQLTHRTEHTKCARMNIELEIV